MNVNYKEAKEELDQIVREIETGEADIDTLSSKIKRAGELITLCRNKLRETEQDVENILNSFEAKNDRDEKSIEE